MTKICFWKNIATFLIMIPAILSVSSYCNAMPKDSGDCDIKTNIPSYSERRIVEEDGVQVTIKFNQKVEGYDVDVSTNSSMCLFCESAGKLVSTDATIHFRKGKQSFKLEGVYYHLDALDTLELRALKRDTIVYCDYISSRLQEIHSEKLSLEDDVESPFFFYDIDFDGQKELLVRMATAGRQATDYFATLKKDRQLSLSKQKWNYVEEPPFDHLASDAIIDVGKRKITTFHHDAMTVTPKTYEF